MTDPTDPTDLGGLPLFAAMEAQEEQERRLALPALRLASPRPHTSAVQPMFGRIDAGPTTVRPVPGADTRPVPSQPTAHTEPARPAGGRGRRVTQAHRVDWSLVRQLRVRASERLEASYSSRLDSSATSRIDRAEEEERGRAVILELLREEAQERLSDGREVWDTATQDQLAAALFDVLFRFGRLQPLLDDERIENIIITAYNDVTIELSDGTQLEADPVAESDEELIEYLVLLASRYGRPFSEAEPELNLALEGETRLAATAWIVAGVSVVIRRNRLRRVTLEDLIQRGTVTPVQASFLRAAIRARRRIVVSGAQGAGKTTLVRALGAEIPERDHVGTFETEYELFLHKLRPRVHPWQARPGSGERGPDGRRLGEVTLDRCLYASFRYNLQWQIVGEVRGGEILTMIEAMQGGSGSMCTTHSHDARGAIERLITAALKAGSHISETYARRAMADSIDLVVHVELATRDHGRGESSRQRVVSEIIAVTPGEGGSYATTQVFQRVPGRPGVPGVFPDHLRGLVEHGFDLEEFYRQAQGGEMR